MGDRENKKNPRRDADLVVDGVDEGSRKRGSGHPCELSLSPEAMAMALIVLNNDDMLYEILLCLGFPIFLMRASLVCKRWLRIVSDRKFLDRFHDLHPPHLIASYAAPIMGLPKLVPPQGLHPELVAIVRRTISYFPKLEEFRFGKSFTVLDWCNGRILVSIEHIATSFLRRIALCSALLPVLDFNFLPRCPLVQSRGYPKFHKYEFLPEDGGDGLSYHQVRLVFNNNRRVVFVQVATFQTGVWGDIRTSVMVDLPKPWRRCKNSGLLVGGKFYMLSQNGYIVGLDLASMSLLLINLPDGVDCNYHGMLDLCRADDYKFYLIHVKGSQILVWLHDTNSNGNTGNWSLTETICLLEVFGPLAKPSWELGGSTRVIIARGGNNVEFVYLGVERECYLMHTKKKTVEKVFEYGAELTCHNFRILPFMMVWPPKFPALNNPHGQGV